MYREFRKRSILVIAAMTVTCATTALSAIITTPAVNSTNNAAFDSNASAVDLVNAGASTLLSGSSSGAFFGINGHNDGVAANNSTNSGYYSNSLQSNLPATIVYDLDLSTNVLGYDIEEIQSIAGWNQNSTTHANQDFEVEVSLVGSALYSSLESVSFLPFNGSPTNGNKSSMVTISEDTTGVLATGVDSLRFTYNATGTWGSASGLVLRELDVFGSPTAAPVPEPSTLMLSAVAVLALVVGYKRRGLRRSRS